MTPSEDERKEIDQVEEAVEEEAVPPEDAEEVDVAEAHADREAEEHEEKDILSGDDPPETL